MAGEYGKIPRFIIDLSKKPRDRYVDLVKQYKLQIRHLTSLFDELLADLGIPKKMHHTINRLARLMLRKVHSSVETEELRGISAATGVRMYLLVAFNVVLDLLMGCTSGAVRSLEKDQPSTEEGMLHFRTLDWGMDTLRSVIVQLDFIKSRESSGTRVLGSSITYAGFVGVLTGVRENLSLSLNFRAVHNGSTKAEHFKFHWHLVLVLLSQRQSISSILRNCLFGSTSASEEWSESPKSLAALIETIPAKHTTAAYLIFSDDQNAVSMEKDYGTAVTRQSNSFIVTTNHDLIGENQDRTVHLGGHNAAMHELLEESADRRGCMVKKWESKIRSEKRKHVRELRKERGQNSESTYSTDALSLRSARSQVSRSFRDPATNMELDELDIEQSVTVTKEELIQWTTAFPTTNECIHFAAILDPRRARVVWAQKHLNPIEVTVDEEPRRHLDVYLE